MLRDFNNPNRIVDRAEYIVYLSSDPDKQYGVNDMWLEPVNSLAQYIAMRNNNCSINQAIDYCEAEIPNLVIEDQVTEETTTLQYIRLN